ncbi:MAG: hypothetical protein ACM3KR_08250 [Deltaproteobacteria bacterium]
MGKAPKIVLFFLLSIVVITLFIEITVKITGKISMEQKKKEGQVKAEIYKKNIEEISKNKVAYVPDKIQLTIKINNFYSLINSNKFEEAYNMLEEDFKKEAYPDIQKFKEYCKESLISEQGKDVSMLYYDNIGNNKYICKLRIRDYEEGEYDPKTKKVVEDFVTVNLIDKNQYKLSLHGFVSSEKVNLSSNAGNVKINVTDIKRLYNMTVIDMDVFNGEQQDISIVNNNTEEGKKNILLSYVPGPAESGQEGIQVENEVFKKQNFVIKPNTTQKFEVQFNVIAEREIKGLSFNNIKVGNEVRTAEIEIKK